ncbi:MAG: hypothetical protein KR126chlam4_01112 [Candidatus Anoxychlamydiales bacterium]|nr:hypothetical protein [Candidatus Anoxychlamydiales bacterium]NGX41273.1 hypothetical protein [Candidatus Anoxychlamydiales bacterium]HEU64485.1 hypothetical protein [Chlamydiota bacterium]
MKKLAFYFTLFPLFLFSYCNISSNFVEENPKKVFLYSDLLYWKTFEDGLDYVYDEQISSSAPTGLGGDVKKATYSWQLGFRVGFKYQMDFDKWTLDGNYGKITPNDSQEILNAENKQMSATFQLPSGFTLTRATSNVRISADFANLLLERLFQTSENIKLSLLSGLSGIWIKRDWETRFFDNNSNMRVIIPSWHFKGVGVKTGLDFDWTMKKGFSWNGKSAIATIFGNYDTWMRAYDNVDSNRVENAHLDDFRVVTNLQFQLGPAWQKDFSSAKLKLVANYEMNVWFNLSQTNRSLYQIAATSNAQSRFTNNIVQMHGLTFYAMLNF